MYGSVLLSRGIGELQIVSHRPAAVTAIAGLLTQFGDVWFLLLWISAVYVLSRSGRSLTDNPKNDCMYLFALVIGAYSLTVVLKHTFGLPRPPGATTAIIPPWLPSIVKPIYVSMVTGHGYGFPSGHALTTTAVYGGAAMTLNIWNRTRQRWIAGITVLVVATTRVVLGVHYIADVVAGIIIGMGFLGITIYPLNRNPQQTLLLASVLGVLAFGMTASVKAGVAAGAAVLGLIMWGSAARWSDTVGRKSR